MTAKNQTLKFSSKFQLTNFKLFKYYQLIFCNKNHIELITAMNKSSTLKDFEIISRLGEGSFASVYKVRRYDDSAIYALKKVKIGQMGAKEKENAVNEVRILASASHPNIINYKEAFFDDYSETLCIVMELAEGGDILKKSNDHIKNKTFFNEAQIWKALLHMSKGLKALHDMNILHRDLKCANIFVTNQGQYKLGDLNVSKVSNKRGMAKTHTGTPYYTAPEIWKDKQYDLKCDIWSLGCVIYEMAALKPPFRASNLRQLYNKIQKGLFDRIPSFYSDDLNNMITQLIKVNPSLRPTTIQILNNSTVLRYTSPSDYYRPQPKQGSLLKTILVPKNLKQLKDALPGAKYDLKTLDVDRSVGKVQERASSVRSLRGGDSQKRMQVLHSFRRMTPSRNRQYSYDNIRQKQIKQQEVVRNNYSRQKQRERERDGQRERDLHKEREMQKQRERVPLSSIERNRSKQNFADISSNRIKQRNLQLKKQHAEVSKNVARALEKVNKIGYSNGVNNSNVNASNLSGRNLVSKPRSQSVDKAEKFYERERLQRVDRVERVERLERNSKQNKYRIFVPTPPVPRPPNRNNISKKYLPPASKLY